MSEIRIAFGESEHRMWKVVKTGKGRHRRVKGSELTHRVGEPLDKGHKLFQRTSITGELVGESNDRSTE